MRGNICSDIHGVWTERSEPLFGLARAFCLRELSFFASRGGAGGNGGGSSENN